MLKKYMIIFILSMLPISELRSAIPLAEVLNLNIFIYYPLTIIGNILPIPLIYIFSKKILIFGSNIKYIGKIFEYILLKGENYGNILINSSKKSNIYFALLIFVGIPLPGTGAWTGTLVASILNLDFKMSCLFISLGVILSGLIMLFGSKLISNYGLFGILIIFLIIILYKIIVSIKYTFIYKCHKIK